GQPSAACSRPAEAQRDPEGSPGKGAVGSTFQVPCPAHSRFITRPGPNANKDFDVRQENREMQLAECNLYDGRLIGSSSMYRTAFGPVLFEVLLVIFLGPIERLFRHDLGDDRTAISPERFESCL